MEGKYMSIYDWFLSLFFEILLDKTEEHHHFPIHIQKI